ncbi:hypothetical protein [Nocardia wallacei]|uniref:hypothetical protein n=1 Tax=Nocardia wallacei TaxID=480035 RepID=UPI002458BB06|nr:hypothetical protein [Nocardia wallacei]
MSDIRQVVPAPDLGTAVDVYAVGVLYELLYARNAARHGMYGEAFGRLKRIPGMWRRRGAWNGYLAEPMIRPTGFRRCGHGWTRRRALADLRRHIAEVNLDA